MYYTHTHFLILDKIPLSFQFHFQTTAIATTNKSEISNYQLAPHVLSKLTNFVHRCSLYLIRAHSNCLLNFRHKCKWRVKNPFICSIWFIEKLNCQRLGDRCLCLPRKWDSFDGKVIILPREPIFHFCAIFSHALYWQNTSFSVLCTLYNCITPE